MLSKSAEATPYEALAEGEEAHWEVCERMLFVYSKINKGIKYVQVSMRTVLLKDGHTVMSFVKNVWNAFNQYILCT